MKMYVRWGRPLALRDGSKQNLIYVVDLKKVPDSAGVYVFGRKWGKRIDEEELRIYNEKRRQLLIQKETASAWRFMQYARGV